MKKSKAKNKVSRNEKNGLVRNLQMTVDYTGTVSKKKDK